MPDFRYSRWDGAQQVFDLDGEDVMEQLSDHLVNHSDIAKALEALAKDGLRTRDGQHVAGVDEILRRLKSLEQDILDRYNLDHILEDIEERIRRIVESERAGIARRLERARERLSGEVGDASAPTPEQMASMLDHLAWMGARNRETLDHLSTNPAEALEQLRHYEFMDDEARSDFDGLMTSLKQQVLDATFKGMLQGLGEAGSQQMSGLKQMLRDLNELLDEHLDGSSPDARSNFDRFMQKYGPSLDLGKPSTVEELADLLQRRKAQMDMLLRSLPTELREQLESVIRSVLQDDGLHQEMARLSQLLQRMSPTMEPAEGLDFRGGQDAGLEQALELLEELSELGDLHAGMMKAGQGAAASVDMALLGKHLGEETCQAWGRMCSLAEELEKSGYLRMSGGRLELTPKGVRKIGQRALQEIFGVIRKERNGAHRTLEKGGGDPSEDTRPYEYGEPFNLHLQRTLLNAVLRSPGSPVHLVPDDFEVQQMDQVSPTSTVLMLDLSLSMATRGNFPAAKKVTLAMDNLIRTQFPHDSLHVVGFSTYAREIRPEQVADLAWDQFDPYTNIQHGLSTARKLLAGARGNTKQIIMISDGEPTAHTEGEELVCQYPPAPRTITETLKEVRRCTRQGITINMFMLDRNSSLVQFVSQMNKINRGKVFYTSPTKLGEYILVDYLTSRRKLVA